MLSIENNQIHFHYDAEDLYIQAWGQNGLRVQATKNCKFTGNNWALVEENKAVGKTSISDAEASIANGKIKLVITNGGKITIFNGDQKILEEYWRNRRDVTDSKCSAIEVEAREFRPNIGGDYHLTFRLESLCKDEKLYGMGQYQQPYLNLKGMDLELAHRNSQDRKSVV